MAFLVAEDDLRVPRACTAVQFSRAVHYRQPLNRTYRDEVLDLHLFETLSQVREVTYRWLQTYNETRPHDSLGEVPPVVFRRRLELESSTSGWSI